MSTLIENIRQAAAQKPEGEVLSSSDFESMGERAAIRRALAELARREELFRLERGLYVAAVTGRFGRRPPSSAKVVASLASKKGERVFSSGAAAANALGLSTQVPIREVYLTSGRSRRLTLGSRAVQLRHAPPVLLQPGIEGERVRARSWLDRRA